MKRITFLIGNGFDINVGLNTRYSDFYKYYLKHNPDDMLAKSIEANYEFWSDLEVGLGRFTSRISSDKEEEFWESEDLLENSLADYLETQMERIQISEAMKTEIAEKIKKSLLQFYSDFPKEQKKILDSVIGSVGDAIVYSFITFNYTDALDRCLQLTKEQFPKQIGSHRTNSRVVYEHSLGNVMHIHGTIYEELILGVNDVEQIGNEEFSKNQFYRQCLIKAEANKRFGQYKIEDSRSIIDTSVIICVFGMSIGATDKMWWEYICKWLMKSDNHRLIIFERIWGGAKRITKRQLFLSQNQVLNRLKTNSGIDENEWKKIEEKIFIKYNSDIFNFKITTD